MNPQMVEELPEEKPALQVLLIDDDSDNQEIYRATLEYSGYTVLQAWNGEEGVRFAREFVPRVILMDIAMPGMDGWVATRLLKEDPTTCHIPVVALTALVLPEDRARAETLGYAAYLSKPIAPREVVEHVRRLIG